MEIGRDGVHTHAYPPEDDGDALERTLRSAIGEFVQTQAGLLTPTVDLGLEPTAALLRDALIASLEGDGEPMRIAGPGLRAPELKLILGGGQVTQAKRPRLTLIRASVPAGT